MAGDKFELLFKWDKIESAIIKATYEYVDSTELPSIDKNLSPEETAEKLEEHNRFLQNRLNAINNYLFDVINSEKPKEEPTSQPILRETFDKTIDSLSKKRDNLLIELLRPFAFGNEGKDSPFAKLDVLDKTLTDTSNRINDIEGYLYHFEEFNSNNDVKLTFQITNQRMKKLDQLFLASNFDCVEGRYLPKQNNNRSFIDKLYYPYKYYFEMVVDKNTAIENGWLEYKNDRLVVAKENYYSFTVRDLGIVYKRDQSRLHNDHLIEASKYICDKVDEALNSTIDDLKALSKNKTSGKGRLIFVDKPIEHDSFVEKISKAEDSSCPQPISPSGSYMDYLDALFNDYQKSHIKLFKVGLGNCIELVVHYNSGSTPNMLIFDAGINENDYGYDRAQVRTVVSNEIINDITTNKVGKVFTLVSHYHPDHYNILTDSLIDLINKLPNPPEIFGIVPNTSGVRSCFLNDVKKLRSLLQPNCCEMANSTTGIKLYENDLKNVFVYIGKGTDISPKLNEDATSFMIQLKKTLLPADTYFRYWPDIFGCAFDSASPSHTKLINFVAPHHGWICKNENTDIVKMHSIYDPSYTTVYIPRHDAGDDQLFGETVEKLFKDFGISKSDYNIVGLPSKGNSYISFIDD